MLFLGQERLSKDILSPQDYSPPPSSGARYRKKQPYKVIFNKPRSSILPGSVPDPEIFVQVKSVIDNAGKFSTDQQSKKKKTQMQEDFQVQIY